MQSGLVQGLFADIERLEPAEISLIVLTHNVVDDGHWFPQSIGSIPVVQISNIVAKGFGANHNAAFRYCKGPMFAVVNPDVRFLENPFPQMLESMLGSRVGLAAPRIVDSNNNTEDSARNLYTPLESLRGLWTASRLKVPPDWVAGMFMLMKSEAFLGVRGFDEKYFMYVEDVDLCARLSLNGWSLRYVESVSVVHHARRASRSSKEHFRWHAHSAFNWWTSSVFIRSCFRKWINKPKLRAPKP
jgi:N-acetylglucosaminyl-diphospho-decaprenol L-rhamnosyltransferase